MHKQIIILGVPIDDLNMDQALDRLEEFIDIGRKEGKSHHVATVNADFAVKARNDPELRRILLEIDMATADGMPLVWGARLLGMHLEGRVTGVDLVPALAERAAKKEYSLYFLGAAPGVAARAADILKQRYPGLKIVGIVSPPKSPIADMDPAIVEDIRKAKPDVLLVAFGNPKQEKWISMYRHQLSVPVMIGIGGTFDFIAGRTKRAPEWMQEKGLEWLFRLIQEPSRLWKRYVTDMRVFGKVFLQQWWLMRTARSGKSHMIMEDSVITSVKSNSSFENKNLTVVETTMAHAGSASKFTTEVYGDIEKPNSKRSEVTLVAVGDKSRSVSMGSSSTFVGPPVTEKLVLSFVESNGLGKSMPVLESTAAAERAPVLESTAAAEKKPVSTVQSATVGESTPVSAVQSATEGESTAVSAVQSATVGESTPVLRPVEPQTRSGRATPQQHAAAESAPTSNGSSNRESKPISHSTTVLHLQGRLDIGNVTAFTEKGQRALLKTPNLIINLAQAEFLDSRALGALVGLTKQARKAGGELWVAEVPPPIYRVLSLLRLDRFLKIASTVESVLEKLAEKPVNEPTSANVGNWAIVKIPNRLDGDTAQEMIQEGLKQLATTPRLVLDFSETSFLASAGLAAMLKLNHQSQAIGGELRLAACSDEVLRTIEMARFDKVLALYNNVQSACN
ncbi:MAG: WecB/TagA/CpsF family glycosyltransferase [Ardenticatenaceae bacterium]